MKQIRIKALRLTNFKGIRDLLLDFYPQETFICGANATGKTTVFDAFCWLLFGKNSAGETEFNLKTLDADGKPIPRLEHSVFGTLLVDDKEITLGRKFTEKWERPRGSETETLTGHKTEFFLNGVKLGTKREYQEVIDDIIPEDVFRSITDPFYFNRLKAEAQKAILEDLAGGISDTEVVAANESYAELLDKLQGISLAQYKSEIAAKKKACKDMTVSIPARIETANKLRPEAEDWDDLEKELSDKQTKLAVIDSQLSDRLKLNQAEFDRKNEIQKEIFTKKSELQKKKDEIKTTALDATRVLNEGIRELEADSDKVVFVGKKNHEALSRLSDELAVKAKDLEDLRALARSINAEQFNPNADASAFVCPTCGRPFEDADIAAKKEKMLASFNADKAARLKQVQEKGIATRKEVEQMNADLEQKQKRNAELKQQYEKLQANIADIRSTIPATPDVEKLVAEDETCIALTNDIQELTNRLNIDAEQVDVSDLKEQKQVLNDNILEINSRLAKREQIAKVDKEIDMLEQALKDNAQVLADLERIEYLALNYQKDKDALLLQKINGLFSYVSFSFMDEQLNGGTKITCVCTIDGVPYSDANNAATINAGLDIINAICQNVGVRAPIFIDNRESVNNLIATESQVVNLVVSTDTELTIKK